MIKANKKEIILASNSPRRKVFFELFNIPFKIKTHDIEETYPHELKGALIARYIATKKANPFKNVIKKNQLVITADTIVWHQDKYLGKPESKIEAKEMLNSVSGKTHKVITAVGFLTINNFKCIDVTTKVTFKKLSKSIIENYINNQNPLDKAGAYAIQESIGHLGITKINGSYTNVVGLPVAEVLDEIAKFSINN